MLFLMLTLMLVSEPQEPSDEPTRAEESRIVRESKAQNLRAPNRTALEKALYEFRERRIMERFQNGLFGLHPLLGGMHTGSGFALGTSYLKDGFRSSGQISFKGYQRVEAGFSAPRLVTDRLFADVHAAYRNYSQEDFYGTGSNSRTEDRTNYGLEDLSYAGRSVFVLKITLKPASM